MYDFTADLAREADSVNGESLLRADCVLVERVDVFQVALHLSQLPFDDGLHAPALVDDVLHAFLHRKFAAAAQYCRTEHDSEC